MREWKQVTRLRWFSYYDWLTRDQAGVSDRANKVAAVVAAVGMGTALLSLLILVALALVRVGVAVFEFFS